MQNWMVLIIGSITGFKLRGIFRLLNHEGVHNEFSWGWSPSPPPSKREPVGCNIQACQLVRRQALTIFITHVCNTAGRCISVFRTTLYSGRAEAQSVRARDLKAGGGKGNHVCSYLSHSFLWNLMYAKLGTIQCLPGQYMVHNVEAKTKDIYVLQEAVFFHRGDRCKVQMWKTDVETDRCGDRQNVPSFCGGESRMPCVCQRTMLYLSTWGVLWATNTNKQ